jgi:sugar lactone lactonase YvrE
MPNRWILGGVTGVAVDSRDHVFVLSIPDYFNARTEIGSGTNPPTGECCTPAPAVLEFDATGALVANWGGPGEGYQWPTTARGIAVDDGGNVWIGGVGGNDTRVLKFSREGKFLMQIGKGVAAAPAQPTAAPAATDTAYAGVSGRAAGGGGRGGAGGGRGRGGGRGAGVPTVPPNNASMESFGGAASISFDAAANEAYIADGSRNHRVAVVDMNTGAIKRVFGAYANKPEDASPGAYSPDKPASKQFGAVSCAEVSRDGYVYVCDRTNDRVQVFKKDGSFVKEKVIAPKTLGDGSVWDVAFSADPQQKYLYVADGMNMKVWVLDRQSLDVLSSFGDGGRQPGQFYAVSAIATDSKGNLYTGETYQGKRVQKFNFKGVAAVTKQDAGVVWPRKGGDR